MSVELPPDVYDAISLVKCMPDLDLARDAKAILQFFERHACYQCAVDWILQHPDQYERGIREGFVLADVLESTALQR